jgi:DNA-binding MarR family transcriptional regulator
MSSSNDRLPAALRQLIEVFMTRSMHDVLRFVKAQDMNMAQYTTLMRLNHHAQCGVGDVGSHLGITTAAASQLVDRLVDLGYVDRAEDPDDRRVKRLTLTRRGRAFVDHSLQARLAWIEDLAPRLPPERHADILQALDDLVAAAQGLPEPDLSHRS